MDGPPKEIKKETLEQKTVIKAWKKNPVSSKSFNFDNTR